MTRIIQSPSPNFEPTTHQKIGVQIHKTLGLMPGTLEWLRNPTSQASAHYLFARNGDIHVLVDIKNRAWTAGVISNPSPRALKIMKKTMRGEWIKPGHYLVQCEFECLADQTFTEEQYQAAVWMFKNSLDFEVTSEYFLEHEDTASGKPDLDAERAEILKRLNTGIVSKPDVEQLKIKVGLLKQILKLLMQVIRLKNLLKKK